MSKNLAIVLTGLAAILILVLVVAFVLLLQNVTGGGSETIENTAVPTEESVAIVPTETAVPTQLPAPEVEILVTDTPLPTDTPTDTPEPTATPEATQTPEPTATNTPVPAAPVVIPTNTPIPPTAAPAPTAVPVNTHGLVGTNFALQPRSSYVVNGDIWYEFAVQNTSGGPVAYEGLGALPKKNGVDRGDLFKLSWGGNNDVINTGGLGGEDWIKLPETGNYTLRLAICFDPIASCRSGASPWVTLSQEIPVTIN
jgi:hypothetical protein